MSNESSVSDATIRNAIVKLAPSLKDHPLVLKGIVTQVRERVTKTPGGGLRAVEIALSDVAPRLLDLEAKFRAAK